MILRTVCESIHRIAVQAAIAVVTLLLQLQPSIARNTNFTHYTVKDGLLNSTVYNAMQDSKGFIWFCTETGVSRYDGRQFGNFTIKNGLADNINFKCHEDKKGRIWFLSYNGQLSYFFGGKIYNKHNTPWLAYKDNGSFLLDCVEDKYDNIWFNTSLGDVLKITGNVVTVIPSPIPERQHNNNYFSSKLFTSYGTAKKMTLIDFHVYEVDLLSQKKTLIDSLPHFLNAPKFTCDARDPLNPEYFLISGTLVKYAGRKFEVLDRSSLSMQTTVLSFLSDNNTFWIATAGEGGARISHDAHGGRTTEYFLKGESITSMLKDAEGNLWLTTHGNGVFLLKNNTNNVTVLSTQPACNITSMNYKGRQYSFAGGYHGNITIYRGLDSVGAVRISTNTLNRINEIIRIDSDRMAFLCDEPIAYIYNLQTHARTPLIMYQGFKAASIDTSGGTWICTQEQVQKLKGNALQIVMETGRLGKLLAFAAISDSLFYIGTANRLYKISGSHRQAIMDDMLLKSGVADIKISNGVVWVATHGNGIFLLKDDHVIKHITTENGLISDVCQKLYDDHKRFIWLGTNNGISVLDRSNGTVFHNLSSGAGLISDDINNICQYNDSVFVATSSGINIFRLGDIMHTAPPPRVFVTALKKANVEITDPGDSVAFDFYKGFLNIHFTALTYEAPRDCRYEYKFEQDREWQHTQITDITLFGLPPGTHKLLLRARKYNSAWSNPIAFTIIVRPLWYQSLWFAVAAGCIIILCLYLLFMVRIRQLKKRTEKQNRYEKQIIELESKSLAYQMNPHFIFNSLNTVQQFILAKDERQGLTYLGEFSKLMRQILENSKKTSILLSEEVAFLRRYMELERTRYSNKFTYSINTGNTLQNEDIRIPPMLLQPLLENAVKHGIASIDNGHITLSLSLSNNMLTAIVEDNGSGIYHINNTVVSAINRESTALRVLEERVKLIKSADGRKGSFTVTDKGLQGDTGTIIEINIPADLSS